MRAIVTIVLIAATTSLSAETLSFASFRIDVPDGWMHSVEAGLDDRVTLHHPDGTASLKILAYDAPVAVSADRLRNMTNVDTVVPLTWQHWGDFAGYQYDYLERGAFYRQWWLVNARTLLLMTYQGDPGSQDGDTTEIDRMARSLTK